MSACLCGSGLAFEECCAPLIAGAPAPTAQALMRSRYTAYAMGKMDYIQRTSTQEALEDFDREDAERHVGDMEWLGLDVLRVVDGGPEDQTGQVEFAFRLNYQGKVYTQHELSTFRRIDGVWYYHDSEMNPKSPPIHTEKTGRNDPCSCGSGKKFKKCCGT